MRSLVVVIASLTVACADSSRDEHSNKGRGSAACRMWQDAACDHFADRCNALDRSECDKQYQAVTCRDDDVATRCAVQLEAAQCGEATTDCLIDSVADFEPATMACEMLVDRFCERSTDCGDSESMDQCVMDSPLDCNKAVGFGSDFDMCLDQIGALKCDQLGLPTVCHDVILSRQ